MYQNIKLNLVLSLPFIFPTEVRTNKTKSRCVVVFTVNVALWREKINRITNFWASMLRRVTISQPN